MDGNLMRRRVDTSPVARLATVDPNGGPHLVPICFVRIGQTVYSAVDAKPKRSPQLRRLDNLRAEPRCCLLMDRYDDDWSQLWWVRLDGRGRLVDDDEESAPALVALAGKYVQYADEPPLGPVLGIDIDRWSGWSA